jgi:hypothetical protein
MTVLGGGCWTRPQCSHALYVGVLGAEHSTVGGHIAAQSTVRGHIAAQNTWGGLLKCNCTEHGIMPPQ